MELQDRLPTVALTPREREVLLLIAEGLTTKKIARQLGITFKTAVSHRAHIMQKLGASNAVTLVRYAIQQKLIEP